MKRIALLTLNISLAWAVLVFIGCGGPAEKTVNVENEQASSNESENSGQSQNSVVHSIQEIVTGATSATPPEGWAVVESPEFKCNIAWPESHELERDCAAKLDDGEFTFGFGSIERTEHQQETVTIEAVVNITEMQMQRKEKLLSETTKENGILRRDFASRGKDTVFARIIVQKTHVWLITAVFPNGKEQDPRVKYFFEKFEPLK